MKNLSALYDERRRCCWLLLVEMKSERKESAKGGRELKEEKQILAFCISNLRLLAN